MLPMENLLSAPNLTDKVVTTLFTQKEISLSNSVIDDIAPRQETVDPALPSLDSKSSPTTESAVKRPSDPEIAKAVKEKKVFQIISIHPMYTRFIIQRELQARGWIEKRFRGTYCPEKKKYTVVYPKDLPSSLRLAKPNFVWTYFTFSKNNYENYPYYSRLIHRQNECNFSCKLGLNNLYPKIDWFRENDTPLSKLIMPRSYLINDPGEKQAFMHDFRFTMCATFLYDLRRLDQSVIFKKNGKHSVEVVNFAIRIVENTINIKKHKDLDDVDANIIQNIMPEMFESYKNEFSLILRNLETIDVAGPEAADDLTIKIYTAVARAVRYFPHIETDGPHNMWIMKPASCKYGCGYGITVYNDAAAIIQHSDRCPNTPFLVQKYLERPLLIYNTKFDIRQYFLVVMDEQHLNIWMYKNCYFKFSGQEFDIDNFSRSIHVTNYTVQRQYKNGVRDNHLPAHNMWILTEFKSYLQMIGQPNKWDKQIYPELVGCIKTVIQGTLESFEFAKNNFQLFGADFMITHDYHPVLIEINSAPDLSPSTISTKIVCGAVVRDIIKVVVDYPLNDKCSTGDFERIYQIQLVNFCPSEYPELEVVGTQCTLFVPDEDSITAAKLSRVSKSYRPSSSNAEGTRINAIKSSSGSISRNSLTSKSSEPPRRLLSKSQLNGKITNLFHTGSQSNVPANVLGSLSGNIAAVSRTVDFITPFTKLNKVYALAQNSPSTTASNSRATSNSKLGKKSAPISKTKLTKKKKVNDQMCNVPAESFILDYDHRSRATLKT